MIQPKMLASAFARNAAIIKQQTEGLTHEDSLLQPASGGNCLNWVVGHLANNRDIMLQFIGAEPVLGPAGERYRRESEPVSGEGEGLLKLEELVAAIERSQGPLSEFLLGASPEDLAREVTSGGRTSTLASRLFFLYFHETYHTGQAELLRHVAGKHDKLI